VSAALEKLVDRYVAELAEDSPVAATFMGIHERDGELGEFGADALEGENARRKKLLAELELLPLDDASLDARIDAVILRTALKESIFEHEVLRSYERSPGRYVFAGLSGCNMLLIRRFAPLEERARYLLSRLRQIPGVLLEMRRNVKDVPAVFATVAAEGARGGVVFVESVLPKLGEEVPSLAADLEKAGAAAAAGFDEAASYLEKLATESQAPFHVGTEAYEWMLRELHLLDFDSEELLAAGHGIIAETKLSLEEVAREIGPGKDWLEVLEDLKREHPGKGDLRKRYASEMARARDFVRENDLVSIPEGETLEVIDTPVFFRSLLPYAAYMPAGPFDDEQRGFFYVTPVDEALSPEEQERQLRGHGVHTIPVIALHEGYPGHHLQISRANRVPHTIRRITWSTVYGEGWALYCEEMMRDAGFYTDAPARLCQLKESLWRAARIVVDASLQRGEMTIDDAIEFMMREATLERVNATGEVKRYAGSPTQPSSYMIGKRAILDIRRRFEEQAGSDFDLKTFHDRLLGLGNIQPALAEVALGLAGDERL